MNRGDLQLPYLNIGVSCGHLVNARADSLVAVNSNGWWINKHWWEVVPQNIYYQRCIA